MPETRPVTAEELFRMGEGRRELVRGRVVEMMPPCGRHGRVAARISQLLLNHIEGTEAGTVFTEVGYRLESDPDTVRAPDVSFVSSARLEGIDDRKYLPLAPDLAVEVVSPGDSFREVEEKAAMWLAHGARLVWVAEPDLEKVFVHRPGGAREVLSGQDELTGDDVLPGFARRAAELF